MSPNRANERPRGTSTGSGYQKDFSALLFTLALLPLLTALATACSAFTSFGYDHGLGATEPGYLIRSALYFASAGFFTLIVFVYFARPNHVSALIKISGNRREFGAVTIAIAVFTVIFALNLWLR